MPVLERIKLRSPYANVSDSDWQHAYADIFEHANPTDRWDHIVAAFLNGEIDGSTARQLFIEEIGFQHESIQDRRRRCYAV